MSIDRRVSCGAGEILVLPVGNVKVGVGVTKFLREAEIDDINYVFVLADAHQEVVWFDIAMDEISTVDILDTSNLRVTTMSLMKRY